MKFKHTYRTKKHNPLEAAIKGLLGLSETDPLPNEKQLEAALSQYANRPVNGIMLRLGKNKRGQLTFGVEKVPVTVRYPNDYPLSNLIGKSN